MSVKRATKVKEFEPRVGAMYLNGKKEKHGTRHDVYYEGTINIEDKCQFIEVHLFSTDGSIKADIGKYYVCANINPRNDYPNFRGCPYCNGNRGVSSKTTNGLTAVAVSKVVMPFLEKEGYKLALDTKYKPGGWWLFDFEAACKERQDLDAGSAPRFYIAWMLEFDCQVHGNFLWKEMEFGA